jgi:hypothetical protein
MFDITGFAALKGGRGILAAKAPGVTFVHTEATQTVYQTGSGRCEFDIIDPVKTP